MFTYSLNYTTGTEWGVYNSKLGIIEKKEIEKYKKIWISQDTLILHIKRKNVLLTFKTINMWHQMAHCLQNDSAVVIEVNYYLSNHLFINIQNYYI